MPESIRAFVAVDLSAPVRKAIADALAALRPGGFRDVRWVAPDSMHLTVKFLGSVPLPVVERVAQALRQVAAAAAPFSLRLGGAGAFPGTRSPRVVWVGVEGDLAALARLHQDVDDALAALGLPRDARPFHPHITLGRVREGAAPLEARRLGEHLARLALAPVSWRVEELVLMRSHLAQTGAVYHRVAVAPLGPPLSNPG